MTNGTRPDGLFGGALPPAGDGFTPAFLTFAHPPCALFARSAADRINSHGYRVARSPNHQWLQRDELVVLMHQRVQCVPDLLPHRLRWPSDARRAWWAMLEADLATPRAIRD